MEGGGTSATPGAKAGACMPICGAGAAAGPVMGTTTVGGPTARGTPLADTATAGCERDLSGSAAWCAAGGRAGCAPCCAATMATGCCCCCGAGTGTSCGGAAGMLLGTGARIVAPRGAHAPKPLAAAMGTPRAAFPMPSPPSSRLSERSSTAFMDSAACRRSASLSAGAGAGDGDGEFTSMHRGQQQRARKRRGDTPHAARGQWQEGSLQKGWPSLSSAVPATHP